MSNLKYENAMNGCHSMMKAMRSHLMEVMSEEGAYVSLRVMLMDAFGSEALKKHSPSDEELNEMDEGFRLELKELKSWEEKSR